MIRTAAITVAAAIGAFLALPASWASASANWLPDEVNVQTAPAELLTQEDRDLLEETGAEPGDVLVVEWVKDHACGSPLCPYVTGESGVPVLVPDGSIAVVPCGHDNAHGGSVYPTYSHLMAYDISKDGRLSQGPYDMSPSTAGYGFVGGPVGGLVWVSDERSTDRRGIEWVRVGYNGTTDAWVKAERLTEVSADAETLPEAHATESTVPTPEPVEETEHAAAGPLTSTPIETPKADASQEAEDGGVPAGAIVGGFVVAALAGSLALRRRRA